MFDPDDTADLEDDLRYPVFYADGRRAGLTDAPTFVSRFVHVAGPAWDVAQTPGEAKAALDLASMAWNVTRLPHAQRLKALGVAVRRLVAHTGMPRTSRSWCSWPCGGPMSGAPSPRCCSRSCIPANGTSPC